MIVPAQSARERFEINLEHVDATGIVLLKRSVAADKGQRRLSLRSCLGEKQRAVAEIEPVARNSNDYQFLDPLARSLLALERTEDSAPILEKLRAMGYRKLAAGQAADQKGK